MEPIWGFLLFVVLCALSWIVASKRGNRGPLYFLLSAALGIGPMFMVIMVTKGQGSVGAALAAFIGAFVGLFLAAIGRTDAQKAETGGRSASHKKCPFCAESIKLEAIKCKHCGSSLEQAT